MYYPTSPRLLSIQTLMDNSPVAVSNRVRVLEPDRYLSEIPGVRTAATINSVNLSLASPQEEKVFIWQRATLKFPEDIPKQKLLLRKGFLIVAEIDDDPQHWPEEAENQFFSYRGCHCIQTSTTALAEFLRQLNPHVAVFPNQLAELPLPRTYYSDSPVTLFFGALNRQSDWQSIVPALNRLLVKYGDFVRVKVICDRPFFEALETDRKEFEAFCSYERYQEIMRSCDIGFLPLEPTRFNRMKSDLKFIEYAGNGVVALASPTVYEQSMVDNETGLIYRTADEFEAKLQEAIANSNLRHRIAANAYQYVQENRLLSQHYRDRYNWYLQMRDSLPELNLELKRRVPELFNE